MYETDSVCAMERRTGLLVVLWVATFPLYRADNLGKLPPSPFRTKLNGTRGTVPRNISFFYCKYCIEFIAFRWEQHKMPLKIYLYILVQF